MEVPPDYTTSISLAFKDLSDPRKYGAKHPLINIITMTLCGVISGCDTIESIAVHAQSRVEFFETILDLSAGVPSADTFHDVLNRIKPAEFARSFNDWVTHVSKEDRDIIAIDGKTLRGTADKLNSVKPLHLVNAWSVNNQVCFGQYRVSEKSNEITAIPKLLKLLDIKNAVITVDAMGCQHAIADLITEEGADYVMALKGNQGNLHDDVKVFMLDQLTKSFKNCLHDYSYDANGDHGRIDERHVWMTTEVDWLRERHPQWQTIQSLIAVKSIRNLPDKPETEEVRLYISSEKKLDAKWIASVVRGHWQIENNLHWQLDFSFKEDELRLRSGHAAENISFFNKLTLSLLKNETTSKMSIKNKRMKACLREDYLKLILDSVNFID